MMNASVAIQVLPSSKGEGDLLRIVDQVIDFIKSQDVSYQVGPFETTIEGDYDQLLGIVKECQKIAVKAGADSVLSYVKILYQPEGEVMTIHEKVDKHR